MHQNKISLTRSDSELKLEGLKARQALKKLLESDPAGTRWPIETDEYIFKPLPESLLPPPLYGFSVYIKELDIHAYWYRDTLHMNKPLVIFKCNADLTGAVCLG